MGSTFYSKRYKSEPGRNRRKRAKTFSSPESAQKWAAENKIEKHEIKEMSYKTSGKVKIKIVPA